MKKTSIISLVILILLGCSQKPSSYTISGKINGITEGKVVLQKKSEGEYVTIDSTQMKAGNFTFTGKINSPEIYYLKIADKKKPINFFVEASEILIKGHIDSLYQVYVTGSKTQDKLNAAGYQLRDFAVIQQNLYKQYNEARKDGNETLMSEINEKWSQLNKERNEKIKELVAENSSNVVGPYLVLVNLLHTLTFDELKAITDNFDASIAESEYVKTLKNRVETLSKVQIGNTAPDFTLNTPDGESLSLSSLKGKYLLIDFWASWCSPCRYESPRVVKLYNDYKDKDFTILSVSLDTKKENWIKAIEDDGLTWHHVSDLQGWNNSAADLYGVKSIPHTVLMDKDQKIIAKNLRGEELRKKLSELLD